MKQALLTLALSVVFSLLAASLWASSAKIKVYIDYGRPNFQESYLVSENTDLLRELYGSAWQSSVAWRTYKILTAEDENRRDLQELINIRGRDVTVRVKVDDIGNVINIPDHSGHIMTKEDGTVERTILRVVFANRSLSSLSPIERVKYVRLLTAAKNDLRARKVYTWPCCYGPDLRVYLPHRFTGRRGLDKYSHKADQDNFALRGLLFHEIAHTQDLSVRERSSYGLDNEHYVDELLTVRAAFKEGWANYYQAIGDPCYAKQTVFKHLRKFRYERKVEPLVETLAGHSEYVQYDHPMSQTPVLCSEMVNAAIFIAMDAGGKNRKKMIAAFAKSNQEYRHVNHLIKAYLDDNPSDALRVLRIIDFISDFNAEYGFARNFGDEHSREYLYGTPYPQRKKRWGDQKAFLHELWAIYVELKGMSLATKQEKSALMWSFILEYKYLDFENMDEEKPSHSEQTDMQLLNVKS